MMILKFTLFTFNKKKNTMKKSIYKTNLFLFCVHDHMSNVHFTVKSALVNTILNPGSYINLETFHETAFLISRYLGFSESQFLAGEIIQKSHFIFFISVIFVYSGTCNTAKSI